MEAESRHRIRRVVFDLRYPDETTAFATRKRLQDLFPSTYLMTIERAFAPIDRSGEVRWIDRLEIDLGRLDPDRLEDAIVEDELRRKVVEAVKRIRPDEIDSRSRRTWAEEALLQFLRTGLLPWHTDERIDELETAVRGSEPATGRFASRLRQALRRPEVRFRLARQCSPAFMEWSVRAHLPIAGRQALVLRWIEGSGGDPHEANERLLRAITRLSAQATPADVARELREGTRRRPGRDGWEIRSSGEPSREGPRLERPGVVRPSGEAKQNERLREAAVVDGGTPEEASRDFRVPEEGLHARHVGVVLLHPFLTRFHNALDLLDHRERYRSAAARVRGIHLLHYLATGDTNPEEHETIVYKILCGYPLEAPLERRLDIEDRERREAESLLEAAIGHWKRLRNTSVDAFREAFLDREGRLDGDEEGWTLIVEQRSIDVLLETLPWSVSTVRLPWMKAPLEVEWPG